MTKSLQELEEEAAKDSERIMEGIRERIRTGHTTPPTPPTETKEKEEPKK